MRTKDIIGEIGAYWNEQSDLDHLWRNAGRILTEHSPQLDAALMFIELVEKVDELKVEVYINETCSYALNKDSDGWQVLYEDAFTIPKVEFSGPLPDCILFMHQQTKHHA